LSFKINIRKNNVQYAKNNFILLLIYHFSVYKSIFSYVNPLKINGNPSRHKLEELIKYYKIAGMDYKIKNRQKD
jgi:hypothetical protein